MSRILLTPARSSRGDRGPSIDRRIEGVLGLAANRGISIARIAGPSAFDQEALVSSCTARNGASGFAIRSACPGSGSPTWRSCTAAMSTTCSRLHRHSRTSIGWFISSRSASIFASPARVLTSLRPFVVPTMRFERGSPAGDAHIARPRSKRARAHCSFSALRRPVTARFLNTLSNRGWS